ncbi:hypothetical protein LAX5112_04642 [Roseibium alexandrii]|uniref:Uncharacterized protein n=1 Tax=Roseibium alexandrii TaxID=388408 RepID=A0A0M7AQ60_9HYPH|nr:hypothetical protein LAX5112_04642 [Roseibium alexandrii]
MLVDPYSAVFTFDVVNEIEGGTAVKNLPLGQREEPIWRVHRTTDLLCKLCEDWREVSGDRPHNDRNALRTGYGEREHLFVAFRRAPAGAAEWTVGTKERGSV